MCDMQKMPAREDDNCEGEEEMNFAAAFQAVGGGHFVTTGGQLASNKMHQNVTNNGTTLSQVVMQGGVVGEGVQYVRALDGTTTVHTPQLISVPIALPGAKPGDPQPTVQIQVLNPNMLQAQHQPKYQMQIPIQVQNGLNGNTVLTLAYSPEGNETGTLQLMGQNTLSESGVQVMMSPQEMQLVQPTQTDDKGIIQNMPQVFITPNHQIIINGPEQKALNNNNEDVDNIIIKEECDDNNDDESSQGTEASESSTWNTAGNSHRELIKYLNSLPPQQAQALPLSLQQFLKRSEGGAASEPMEIEVEVPPKGAEPVAEAIIGEDGTVRIQSKKKKKYKKKPKPARVKPGQVVIAVSADGNPIYCCPECHMAYPDKEQLETHLTVHKIERRFICGICGAGLKRKEHLERHKLGHNPERPYVCTVCRKGFKRREHLNLHTVIHSGVKTEMCTECGKGFYRKDHLRKHTRSHETKRLREEASADAGAAVDTKPVQAPVAPAAPVKPVTNAPALPEIIVHVPTSGNLQMPVQINIPPHVVSSLQAQAQAHADAGDAHAHLDALLAQHT